MLNEPIANQRDTEAQQLVDKLQRREEGKGQGSGQQGDGVKEKGDLDAKQRGNRHKGEQVKLDIPPPPLAHQRSADALFEEAVGDVNDCPERANPTAKNPPHQQSGNKHD